MPCACLRADWNNAPRVVLYNVHEMKRYTVAQVRERLASALDEVERGVPVVIERRGDAAFGI